MAKTNAERQAALKSKRNAQKRRQLNVWVPEDFYLSLKRLAEEHDLTLGEALEQFVSFKN